MKSRLLLFALALFSSQANAQAPLPSFRLPEAALSLPTAKTTATSERVIAAANYSTESSVPDSFVYTWSGSRSSKEVASAQYNVSITDYDVQEYWRGLTARQSRQLQTFDGSGNLITYESQTWDPGTLTWQHAEQTTVTYSGTLKASSLTQSWDNTTSTWVNKSRVQNTYSGADLTLAAADIWLPDSSKWRAKTQTSYTYAGGYLSVQIDQKWDTATKDWRNFQKIVFDGYTAGIPLKATYYYWTTASSDWQPGTQDVKTYNSAGLITSDTLFGWNTTTLSWGFPQCEQYTYSGTNLMKYARFTGDGAGAMIPYIQVSYTYSGGQRQKMEVAQWDDTYKYWDLGYRNMYTYNSNGSLILSYIQYFNHDVWENPTSIRRYYYEAFGTSAGSVSVLAKPVSLYPNPAVADHVYLDYTTKDATATTILLTDLMGRVLYRGVENGSIGDHSVKIPIASLASGVYVVQLFSKDQLCQSLKLVK